MNCNLSDNERKTGNRCRSWDCIPCKEFGLTVNDASIINIHMDNMRLKEENKKLRVNLNTCKNDYSFMINLIEKYSTDKDECLRDCLERMKFRKGLFNILDTTKDEK